VQARTLHKVHLLVARGPVKGLEDVRTLAAQADWSTFLAPGQSFGVRAVRHGTHAFTSVQVGGAVGAAVQRQVEGATGSKPPVDLDAPGVEVSALVRDEEAVLGVNLTGESLHARGYRRYQHPAPLKGSLAAALLHWAGYDAAQALWDPMCGSATIPIEGALMARSMAPNPLRPFACERLRSFPGEVLALAREQAQAAARPDAPARIVGTERFEKHLLGAAENARAAGVWDALHLRVLDATQARAADLPFPPDLVVVNPPYGLRIASTKVVARLYDGFLKRVGQLEPPQGLVVLVGNRIFEEVAARRGLAAPEVRDVVYGDLPARLLRFRFGERGA
jgi:tRNA (guanine6-N2)-methyltransferase